MRMGRARNKTAPRGARIEDLGGDQGMPFDMAVLWYLAELKCQIMLVQNLKFVYGEYLSNIFRIRQLEYSS